jgi:hypothetical protein
MKVCYCIRLPSKSLPEQTVKLISLNFGAKEKSFAAFARIATFLILKQKATLAKVSDKNSGLSKKQSMSG